MVAVLYFCLVLAVVQISNYEYVFFLASLVSVIANEPAERRREAGEAAAL